MGLNFYGFAACSVVVEGDGAVGVGGGFKLAEGSVIVAAVGGPAVIGGAGEFVALGVFVVVADDDAIGFGVVFDAPGVVIRPGLEGEVGFGAAGLATEEVILEGEGGSFRIDVGDHLPCGIVVVGDGLVLAVPLGLEAVEVVVGAGGVGKRRGVDREVGRLDVIGFPDGVKLAVEVVGVLGLVAEVICDSEGAAHEIVGVGRDFAFAVFHGEGAAHAVPGEDFADDGLLGGAGGEGGLDDVAEVVVCVFHGFPRGEAGFRQVAVAVVERLRGDSGGIGGGDGLAFAIEDAGREVSENVAVPIVPAEEVEEGLGEVTVGEGGLNDAVEVVVLEGDEAIDVVLDGDKAAGGRLVAVGGGEDVGGVPSLGFREGAIHHIVGGAGDG